MSRFTGKSDFCDTCTMHYEPKEIVEHANIFMGNAKVHVQQERDLIPYYTNLISVMYSTRADNGLEMSISLSEDSFIDSEERSRLSWRVANIISIARKCKRNKVPFTFEQVQKDVDFSDNVVCGEPISLWKSLFDVIEQNPDIIKIHLPSDYRKKLITIEREIIPSYFNNVHLDLSNRQRKEFVKFCAENGFRTLETDGEYHPLVMSQCMKILEFQKQGEKNNG